MTLFRSALCVHMMVTVRRVVTRDRGAQRDRERGGLGVGQQTGLGHGDGDR
jgi:hypothetical protein